MKKVFILAHDLARKNALEFVKTAPEGYSVTIAAPTRNLEQNAAQWPILQAFSDQLQWPINGRMESLQPDDWKSILSSAFKKESARITQGIDGGIVMLGARTSKMSKSEFSEYLDFLNATAALRGIVVYNHDNENTRFAADKLSA